MKHLKILGLAVVAAAALMALVGAGTASAETTLCTVTQDACEAAQMMGPGTGMEKISASLETGTEAILKVGFGTLKCKKSTVKGKVETTTTPEGKIETLTFEECNCPVTVIRPGKLQVHWDAEHNGNLTLSEFEAEANCTSNSALLNQHCWYAGTVTEKVTVLGGNPAKLKAEEALVPVEAVKSTSLCGTSGKWTATYQANEPMSLYVSKGL